MLSLMTHRALIRLSTEKVQEQGIICLFGNIGNIRNIDPEEIRVMPFP